MKGCAELRLLTLGGGSSCAPAQYHKSGAEVFSDAYLYIVALHFFFFFVDRSDGDACPSHGLYTHNYAERYVERFTVTIPLVLNAQSITKDHIRAVLL